MDMSMDKEIGSASVRLSKKITRIVNYYLKSFNITTEQWGVLRTLNETGRVTQKLLSDRADKDQATLTKILDLLEKHEYVQRVRNPEDRRSFFVNITQNGSKLVEEVGPYLEEIYKNITAEIADEKLAIYQDVMRSLEGNIDALLDEANK